MRVDVLVEDAHRALEHGLAGDDVEPRAGVERAHRHDDGVERAELAAGYGLQRQHYGRGSDGGVDALVGERAVACLAGDRQLEVVGGGVERALGERERASGPPGEDVLAEGGVHAVQDALLNDALRTAGQAPRRAGR